MSTSSSSPESLAESAHARIADRAFRVGVIGLGYVGLPLTKAFWEAGFRVVGFDTDPAKIDALMAGRSYFKHFSDAEIAALVGSGRFYATGDFSAIAEVDAIIICVPTPLDKHREPDISYIVRTAEAIAPKLRAGQIVVLESTTYPGTTREVVRPILETSGLGVGDDLFLAYSPEREDPGNSHYRTATIPKVVGADDPASRRLATALYASTIESIVEVSSSDTAEAVKLSENIFRSVNIALVNELKVVFDRMGIDIWEVIEAAKTKPFGYMPFYPGPGLGGHCIPIDPFYLTWKAREFDISTRFIELAGEINSVMPRYVVDRLASALDERFSRALSAARVLILGAAYKKNVDDMRESPALVIIELLKARRTEVAFYDPYVPEIPRTRKHSQLAGMKSVKMTEDELSSYDAVMIVTDHDCVDYGDVVCWSRLVIDTRNATRDVKENRDRIVKA
jgi:UDP-N-acetyl-D-glucosamine dehydrogenase